VTGLFVALALARALDVTTSCMVLARPGGAELNPLMPGSCRAQVGVQAGLAAVQIWGLNRLRREHSRAAAVLGMITISIEVGATTYNVRSLH
jgi:hypothetical protein